MKISKSLLSKLNLFAAALNATINPTGYNIRMAAECFNAEVNKDTANSISVVTAAKIETNMKVA